MLSCMEGQAGEVANCMGDQAGEVVWELRRGRLPIASEFEHPDPPRRQHQMMINDSIPANQKKSRFLEGMGFAEVYGVATSLPLGWSCRTAEDLLQDRSYGAPVDVLPFGATKFRSPAKGKDNQSVRWALRCGRFARDLHGGADHAA